MKDYWILKVLDFFACFYRVMGVNYSVMRKVLQIKLLMDRRRVPSILMMYKHYEEDNSFDKSLIIYGLIGVIIAWVIPSSVSLFLKMNMLIGMLIFMVTITMISDFSTLLLDTKDKEILISKPINSQTINAAKITHILINVLTIIFVMSGPSLIVGIFKYGLLFSGILLFDLPLISGLVLLITSVLYFLMLLAFDGDKLKDMITYFQIILSLLVMIGVQFADQFLRFIGHYMASGFEWWIYLLPSTWFAAPFSLILEKRLEPPIIQLSLIGVLAPILLLILYFRVVIQLFEENLYKLDKIKVKKGKILEKRALIYQRILSLIIPNKQENIFCRFSQNMISSDRSIKLYLYPNLGFAIFFPLVLFLNRSILHKSLNEPLVDISKGSFYFLMYLSVAMLSTTAITINSSDNYKGAWVYKALPIDLPGAILVGALKGFILRYLIPLYLFLSLIFAVPYGLQIIPHLVLICLNMMLLIILFFKLSLYELPFSKMFKTRENNLGSGLCAFGFCGISGLLHNALRDLAVGLFIYTIAVLAAAAFLWKTTANITWKDV